MLKFHFISKLNINRPRQKEELQPIILLTVLDNLFLFAFIDISLSFLICNYYFQYLNFSNSFKRENFEMLHFLNTLIKDSQLIYKDKMKQF